MFSLPANEGFTNFFPDDHKYFSFLKKVFRHEFRRNGFRRISTQMRDNGVLRESAEKLVLKAYMDNNVDQEIQPVYYYYMDHFFPKGVEEVRIGAEILGEDDPILDALLVYMTDAVFRKIGFSDMFVIHINSNGISKERMKYREELYNFYFDKHHLLSPESVNVLEVDPIALLFSEYEDEKILAQNAPSITRFLKKDSKSHHAKFKEYLDLLGVSYVEDESLVVSHDYCTHNVWEFRDVVNQGLMSTGFRYNALGKEIGSLRDIPAVGFHTKIEYLITLLRSHEVKIRNKDAIDLFFVQLGDDAKKVVLPISLKARDCGINTVVSLGTPSLKEQMLKATRSGAKFIVIVGFMEAKNGIFQLRDVEAGTQIEMPKEEIIDYIIERVGKDALNFYCPTRDLIIG